MDPHVRQRGPLSGEIGAASRNINGLAYFPYTIRSITTGEVVCDGYAGDLQEAVQTVDLCLDYLLNRTSGA